MLVTNQKSTPGRFSCVAIGREISVPSNFRLVSIAVSMPSTSEYNSSIFFAGETSSFSLLADAIAVSFPLLIFFSVSLLLLPVVLARDVPFALLLAIESLLVRRIQRAVRAVGRV